jgi:hypothetical protein
MPLESSKVRVLEWDLGPQSWGAGRAVALVPTWGEPGARFPLLIALHGRGEALKSPVEGALGWPRDYALVRAFERLRAPPLTTDDYEGFVEAPRLEQTNVELVRQPFRGLVVVCPYMPDIRPMRGSDAAVYQRFVLDVVLPRARAETPVCTERAQTGIDGVSLGGAMALRVGLSAPDVFGGVGGVQPAVAEAQVAEWTQLAIRARARRPDLRLRLLTSHDDMFRDAISALSRSWAAAGIQHDFAEVAGPHDYSFNRGPGSMALLLWHDRALGTCAR